MNEGKVETFQGFEGEEVFGSVDAIEGSVNFAADDLNVGFKTESFI